MYTMTYGSTSLKTGLHNRKKYIFFDFVFTCITIYMYNDLFIMFKFTCNNFVFGIEK